jgi:hypothetical protein
VKDRPLWGPFLTLPLGKNFKPRGELCPMGVKFYFCLSILLNSRECSPHGVNEGLNIPPRGQISPLGAKFNHWGEVYPWGPGVKLRMAFWSPCYRLRFFQLFNLHRFSGPIRCYSLSLLQDEGRSRDLEQETPSGTVLNFTPGPQGGISPLGVNLAPRGEIFPLGVKYTPSFTPRGEHSL